MLRLVTVAVALFVVAACPVGAQLDGPLPQPGEPLRFRGLSLGLAGGEVVTLSYRYTQVGRRGLTFDGAVATAPQALAYGALVLGLPLGPAVSIPFEGGAVMLKGGAMPLIAASGEGGGGALTGYYGVALVVGKREGMGLRVDWTHHGLLGEDGDDEGFGILEVGFVQSIR